MNRLTPAWAVASILLIAPSWSTARVLAWLPAPAPALQITVVAFVSEIVLAKSETDESSMLWTIGVPPRDLMSGICDSLRMMEWTVWPSDARRRVMWRATLPEPPKMRVDVDGAMVVCLGNLFVSLGSESRLRISL